MTTTHLTPSHSLLSSLDPLWLKWICESLHRGVSDAQIEEVLSNQGDPAPSKTIEEIRSNPLYQWGSTSLKDQSKANDFLKLHKELWSLRTDPIPRVSQLPPSQFFADYYLSLRLIIITDWVSKWAAIERWDPEHWITQFADVEIEVSSHRNQIERYDRCFDHVTKTTLGAFSSELLALTEPCNDRYLIARNYAFVHPKLKSLWDDVDERPYMNPNQRQGAAALWFGPAGTNTPLHHDTCQIMFAQIRGEKRFSLIPPHAQELYDQATNMYSDLPSDLDLWKFPQHPHQLNVTLKAGEALFIPVGWWHAVRSVSLSISLAMTHFDLPNQFDWFRPGQKK